MEGKATNCILLRPNPCPLDSRFHGNDIRRGCRMPLLTPPQADGVLKRHNKMVSIEKLVQKFLQVDEYLQLLRVWK